METEKLLPCPFCGGDAHWSPTFTDTDTPGVVQCANGCGATVIAGGSKPERIAAWNTRAPADLRSALEAETSAAAWVNSIPGVRPSDQFIAADRRALESMVARALAASAKGCRA